MVTRRDLEDQLLVALEPVLDAVPTGRFDWDDGVQIGDFDVGLASRCQAAAASPPGEFSPDVFTTFKAVARGAVRGVVTTGGVRSALSAHVVAARRGDGDVEPWIAEFLSRCDQPTLVETIHRAATWLHRSAAVLGDDTLARHGPGRRLRWDHPEHALRLKANVDLIADDDNVAVMVVPQLDDARLDQIAFAAMLYTLQVRSAPGRVRVVVQSTAELVEIDGEDLWPRALPSAARAVAAVAARASGPVGLHRSASFFTCRSCAWSTTCDVRETAEARRPRIRQGIRFPD